MNITETARKIVLDRRGEIYPKWKKELPLAIAIAETLSHVTPVCQQLFRHEISEAEGISYDMIEADVSGWVLNELRPRIDLTEELRVAMPGALRRARQFLIEVLKHGGHKESDLHLIHDVNVYLDGRHAYRKQGDQYGLRLYRDNDGKRTYLGAQIRDFGRFKGYPVSACRAHRCFRGIRRKLMAFCIGAGDGRMEVMSHLVKIWTDESRCYDYISRYERLDLDSPENLALIDKGEKLIEAAIVKAKEQHAKRQAEIEKAKKQIANAPKVYEAKYVSGMQTGKTQIAYTSILQEAVRSAYEAERADAATRERQIWGHPVAAPRTPNRTRVLRLMDTIDENGWRATPPDDYPGLLAQVVARARMNASQNEAIESAHRWVVDYVRRELSGIDRPNPNRPDDHLDLLIALDSDVHVRFRARSAPVPLRLAFDPAMDGRSEMMRAMMDSYIRPTSAYYSISNVEDSSY